MESAPFVFYCHPYELDPLELKEIPIKIPLRVRLHQGVGSRWFKQRLKGFLNEFGGQPIENLLLSRTWPGFHSLLLIIQHTSVSRTAAHVL